MLAHGLVMGLAGERPASAAHINRGDTLLRYNLTFGPFCVTNSGLGQNLAKMTPQRCSKFYVLWCSGVSSGHISGLGCAYGLCELDS